MVLKINNVCKKANGNKTSLVIEFLMITFMTFMNNGSKHKFITIAENYTDMYVQITS